MYQNNQLKTKQNQHRSKAVTLLGFNSDCLVPRNFYKQKTLY